MARTLVVEDEADLLYSIKKGLTRNEFEVDAYDYPLDALVKFKPNTYHMLLIDIRMPKMNGFELHRAIKKSGDVIDLLGRFHYYIVYDTPCRRVLHFQKRLVQNLLNKRRIFSKDAFSKGLPVF